MTIIYCHDFTSPLWIDKYIRSLKGWRWQQSACRMQRIAFCRSCWFGRANSLSSVFGKRMNSNRAAWIFQLSNNLLLCSAQLKWAEKKGFYRLKLSDHSAPATPAATVHQLMERWSACHLLFNFTITFKAAFGFGWLIYLRLLLGGFKSQPANQPSIALTRCCTNHMFFSSKHCSN